MIPNLLPTADGGNSSKTKGKIITKAAPAHGILDTGSKSTHSKTPKIKKKEIASKIAFPAKTTHSKLSKIKEKETVAERASPAKTRNRV